MGHTLKRITSKTSAFLTAQTSKKQNHQAISAQQGHNKPNDNYNTKPNLHTHPFMNI